MPIDVVVPKLNNNDESCVLNAWLVEDGARVEIGTPLAMLETSKATSELVAEAAGVIQRLVAQYDECRFGSSIAQLFASDDERKLLQAQRPAAASGGELVITKGAQELIDKHGIGRDRLLALKKNVLKAADIEALLVGAAKGPQRPMSAHQAAVARTVSASHATIPAAFLAMRVWTDKAIAGARAMAARHQTFIGLAELLVKIVGSIGEEFPIFYGVDASPDLLAAPNVGVTFDLGEGLFIPVVRAPRKLSLPDIAARLMEFRLKTARGAFKNDDLADGHVSISLNTEDDVVLTVPIIQPGQTCMLSIGAAMSATPDGGPTSITMGLAYDHRYINGFDAMQFCKAIKERIESGEDLA